MCVCIYARPLAYRTICLMPVSCDIVIFHQSVRTTAETAMVWPNLCSRTRLELQCSFRSSRVLSRCLGPT